jgi:hypothetical protein
MVFHQYDMHKNKKGRRGVVIGGAGKAQGSQGEGEKGEREGKERADKEKRKRERARGRGGKSPQTL